MLSKDRKNSRKQKRVSLVDFDENDHDDTQNIRRRSKNEDESNLPIQEGHVPISPDLISDSCDAAEPTNINHILSPNEGNESEDVLLRKNNSTSSSSPYMEANHKKSKFERLYKLAGCLSANGEHPTCCSCCHKKRKLDSNHHQLNSAQNDSDIKCLYEDEPFRKRACRVCFTFVYVVLATVAIFATYSMVNDLVVSVQNPVRSIHYKKSEIYDAPGIAVYPGGADFLACGHYYNNVVTSKVRLSQLDLLNRNCTFTNLTYTDPHYNTTARNVLVFSGPTSFKEREAIFLHFSLEDDSRDFFTVSYFVFSGYAQFANSSVESQAKQIMNYHTYVPTFALSAGLRMWIKLVLSETFLLDGTHHTNFDVEYSVVKFHDRRNSTEREKHLFFIFFEWKNNIVEQSTLLYTTTPWSVLAGLCGVFLMLHRFYVLAQTSYKRVQKDKRRRTLRKETLRKLRESRSSTGMEDCTTTYSEKPVFV